MIEQQLKKHKDKIVHMLHHAKKNAPYYSDTLPNDMDARTVTPDSWSRIPIIEKKDIQDKWKFFLSNPDLLEDPNADITIRTTSGSTGIPLKIVRDNKELLGQAVRIWSIRNQKLSGVFTSKCLCLDPYKEQELSNILHFTKNGYVDFSIAALRGYVERINRFKPIWITGFSTVVYRLAKYYRTQKIKIPEIKFIEVTGEQIFPNEKKFIEETFQCQVTNQYGCQEVDFLSYECNFGAMHTCSDNIIYEVVRDSEYVKEGEPGELVVTSLSNYCMPLIRYRVGDIVTMETSNCPCGNKHPVLTPIGGRKGSLIRTTEKTVSSSILKRLFDDFMGIHDREISEYQVIQPTIHHMNIYIVSGSSFDKNKTCKELQKEVEKLFPELKIQFILTENIKIMPSGKTQRFISNVSEDAVLS